MGLFYVKDFEAGKAVHVSLQNVPFYYVENNAKRLKLKLESFNVILRWCDDKSGGPKLNIDYTLMKL
jgi:hypothetical protein